MFLIDDILLAPLKGVMWVAQEVQKAAQQELVDESDAITLELSQLYMMLETGKITEAEFEAREQELLDRLDNLPERQTLIAGEDDDEDE